MTVISTENKGIAMINVFTVKPGRQQELVDFLIKSTEEVMSHYPGFISANFHKSTCGRFVANYAQWESQEAWENMQKQPGAQAEFAHIYTMANAAFAAYDVTWTCECPGCGK